MQWAARRQRLKKEQTKLIGKAGHADIVALHVAVIQQQHASAECDTEEACLVDALSINMRTEHVRAVRLQPCTFSAADKATKRLLQVLGPYKVFEGNFNAHLHTQIGAV